MISVQWKPVVISDSPMGKPTDLARPIELILEVEPLCLVIKMAETQL